MNDRHEAAGPAPVPVFTDAEVAAGEQARSTFFLWSLALGATFGIGWVALLHTAAWFHLEIYRSAPWWLELLAYVVATRTMVALIAIATTISHRRARRRAGVALRPSTALRRAMVVGQVIELTLAMAIAGWLWGIARAGERSWLLALPVPFAVWLAVTHSSRRVLRLQLPLEPLRDERCTRLLAELAADLGIAPPRAELLRSSEWSPAVNAAVLRDGRKDALVVFDTALELPDDQLRALLAHELGHVVRSDARTIATVAALVSATAIVPAFAVLPNTSLVGEDDVRLDATAPVARSLYDPATGTLGLPECRLPSARLEFDCVERLTNPHGTTPYRGLPLAYVDFFTVSFVFATVGTIARGIWQRGRERDADLFALETTRDPAAFVRLVRTLTVSAGAAVHARAGVGCAHASPAQRIALVSAWADERGLRPSASPTTAITPATPTAVEEHVEDEAQRARADERDEQRPQPEVADAATARRVEERTADDRAEHAEEQRVETTASLDAGDPLRERAGDEPDDDPTEEPHEGAQSSGT